MSAVARAEFSLFVKSISLCATDNAEQACLDAQCNCTGDVCFPGFVVRIDVGD